MRCWVYIPTGGSSERIEVDVESLPALLEKLSNEAPLGTRVVELGSTRVNHFILRDGGWQHALEVIVA